MSRAKSGKMKPDLRGRSCVDWAVREELVEPDLTEPCRLRASTSSMVAPIAVSSQPLPFIKRMSRRQGSAMTTKGDRGLSRPSVSVKSRHRRCGSWCLC